MLFRKKSATDMTSCRSTFHDIIEYHTTFRRAHDIITGTATSVPGRPVHPRVMASSPVPGATGTGTTFFKNAGSRFRKTHSNATRPCTAALLHRSSWRPFRFPPPPFPAEPGAAKPENYLLFRKLEAKLTHHNEKGLDNCSVF